MLVLSRKVGERIHVGDDITVEIRRIAGNRVTIALAAPRDVRILRGELERAAREFREPDANDSRASGRGTEDHRRGPSLPVAGRIAIINSLPTPPVERDFAI
jgi:carbon storage regulator